MEGVEQAINVGTGSRCIEFLGRGMDTIESDTRIYYLISGASPGKRIVSRVLTPTVSKLASTRYSVTVEKKEKTSYIPKLLNGEADNWVGRYVGFSPVVIPFTLTGVDFASPISDVTLKMQGFPNINAPEFQHVVRIRINGFEVGDVNGIGSVSFSGRFRIPTSTLLEGANALELTSINNNDNNLFDSVTVSYGRKFQADQNQISFFTPGQRRVNVTGFTSPNVRVFDTTNQSSPVLVTNFPVVEESGSFTVKMPPTRAIVAYAVEDSAVLDPHSVSPNNASSLSTVSNSAELIIVSHSQADFIAAAETWANYRRGQGFTVKVVDIADVFDEFSYGSVSSVAINGFLRYAHESWQIKPKYVMLVGDATYDPRNYEGHGNFNLIPTRMVSLILSETASDEALADFNNDGLAELAVGRIPVRRAAEITTVFNKTVLYESSSLQPFARGSLFAYDIPSGWDFQLTSEAMRAELPNGAPVTQVGRGGYDEVTEQVVLNPAAHTELINGLNAGQYIVNYSGHGSSGLWASPSFFANNDAAQLTNAQRPTVFTMLTCLNGYFLRPDADSLSEVLIKNVNGGAVATWASTADTTPDIQTIMGVRFYDQLASGNIVRMGDLIKDAKAAIPGGADVRLSWALLGDPMLKLR
jgi:hypothetical protein